MDSTLFEGAELVTESGKTYLAVGPLGQSNVWTAAEKDNFSNVVVLKAPSDTDANGSWPAFQHEMIMHEMFKESKFIRKQVDRIPPTRGGPPMLVLEIAEGTLWHARTKRPLSRGEIVTIVRAILQGLEEIHAQGLVYGDLKMENVMVSGFDAEHPGDGSELEVKLGDLGTVMYPANGTLQPVAYRAPEVFFAKQITPSADIWSLGLIYSHLVEAQSNFGEPGMYDDLIPASSSLNQRANAVQKQMLKDFDLRNNDYYKECAMPVHGEKPAAGSYWQDRGLDQRDVDFLERVMIADPRERPTARAILASYWFQGGGLEKQASPSKTDVHVGTSEKQASPSKPDVHAGTQEQARPSKPDVHAGTEEQARPSKPNVHAGSANLAVQPPVVTTASSNISSVASISRSKSGSLKMKGSGVNPVKVDSVPVPQVTPIPVGGNATSGGTFLNYR